MNESTRADASFMVKMQVQQGYEVRQRGIETSTHSRRAVLVLVDSNIRENLPREFLKIGRHFWQTFVNERDIQIFRYMIVLKV